MSETYFRKGPRKGFSIFETKPLGLVITLLNHGLESSLGGCAIHASPKGLRITIRGKTVAKGKTAQELERNFELVRQEAIAAKEQD